MKQNEPYLKTKRQNSATLINFDKHRGSQPQLNSNSDSQNHLSSNLSSTLFGGVEYNHIKHSQSSHENQNGIINSSTKGQQRRLAGMYHDHR